MEFQTAAPVVPKQYVLITGNDNESFKGRNPSAWNILAKASGDDGWTTIAAVTDSYGVMEDRNYTAYTFDCVVIQQCDAGSSVFGYRGDKALLKVLHQGVNINAN